MQTILHQRGAFAASLNHFQYPRDGMAETAAKPWTSLGPIGDAILFENEYVRVWSVSLDPGARQPWHQHFLPYLIVPLTLGKNEMRFADGKVKLTDEKPGEVLWREAGIPHELLNISDWHYRNVLIEMKSAGQGPPSRAPDRI